MSLFYMPKIRLVREGLHGAYEVYEVCYWFIHLDSVTEFQCDQDWGQFGGL